jgi:hypothetical protein
MPSVFVVTTTWRLPSNWGVDKWLSITSLVNLVYIRLNARAFSKNLMCDSECSIFSLTDTFTSSHSRTSINYRIKILYAMRKAHSLYT